MYHSNSVGPVHHMKPRITGIGHGEVFTQCKVVPDEFDQFASSEVIGRFYVFGISMNTYTIYDSPYGNVEVEWSDPDGQREGAVLPVLDRDADHGAWFAVGVIKDPRYVPANFRFDKLSYNDFATDAEVMGDMSTMKACPYTDGACAPLAPYEAYDIRVRSPFLRRNEWYCNPGRRRGYPGRK